MSTAAEIAVALTAAINGAEDGTFSESFTAVRSVAVDPEGENVTALRVDVVTRSMATKQVTRGSSDDDHAVFVVIQKPAPDGPLSVTDLDSFMDLVQEFVVFLNRNNLSLDSGEATWNKTDVTPLYAHGLAISHRRYLSTLVVHYHL